MNHPGTIAAPALRTLASYAGSVNNTQVGVGPRGLAITPDSSFVYVVNYGSNNVSKVNLLNGVVVSTITVGTGPVAIAISPDGYCAYVCNNSSSNLTKIILATGTTSTVSSGTNPSGCAFTQDGQYLYVCNMGDDNVWKIRVSDGVNTATISTDAGPCAVAVSPDGTLAYVANYDADSITRIVVGTNATTSISVGVGPSAVAFAPDGIYAYVALNTDGTIYRITVASSAATSYGSISAVGGFGIAVSPDSSMVYGAFNNSGGAAYVKKLNALTGEFDTINLGNGCWSVAFAKNGTVACVSNNASNSISRIKVRSGPMSLPEFYAGLSSLFSGIIIGIWFGEDLVLDGYNNVTSWPDHSNTYSLTNSSATRFTSRTLNGFRTMYNTAETGKSLVSSAISGISTFLAVANMPTLPFTDFKLVVGILGGSAQTIAGSSGTSNLYATQSTGNYVDSVETAVVTSGIHLCQATVIGTATAFFTGGLQAAFPGYPTRDWTADIACIIVLSAIPSALQRTRALNLCKTYYQF